MAVSPACRPYPVKNDLRSDLPRASRGDGRCVPPPPMTRGRSRGAARAPRGPRVPRGRQATPGDRPSDAWTPCRLDERHADGDPSRCDALAVAWSGQLGCGVDSRRCAPAPRRLGRADAPVGSARRAPRSRRCAVPPPRACSRASIVGAQASGSGPPARAAPLRVERRGTASRSYPRCGGAGLDAGHGGGSPGARPDPRGPPASLRLLASACASGLRFWRRRRLRGTRGLLEAGGPARSRGVSPVGTRPLPPACETCSAAAVRPAISAERPRDGRGDPDHEGDKGGETPARATPSPHERLRARAAGRRPAARERAAVGDHLRPGARRTCSTARLVGDRTTRSASQLGLSPVLK